MSEIAGPTRIYYLEMLSPSDLIAKEAPEGIVIGECDPKQYQFNRFLYTFIGRKWLWTERLHWTDSDWREYVESVRMRTWVAYKKGTIAGYYELLKGDNGDVEIIYFGLTDSFIGKGCGGYLLTAALKSAWGWPGTKRVWVHTCTLDHPNALQNYRARGMKLYKKEVA